MGKKKTRCPRKPADLFMGICGIERQTAIASVHKNVSADQFAEAGDPLDERYEIEIMGQDVFDGIGAEEQIKICRKLAPWLSKYADHLEYRYKNQSKLNIQLD